jgi:hypothetical protein
VEVVAAVLRVEEVEEVLRVEEVEEVLRVEEVGVVQLGVSIVVEKFAVVSIVVEKFAVVSTVAEKSVVESIVVESSATDEIIVVESSATDVIIVVRDGAMMAMTAGVVQDGVMDHTMTTGAGTIGVDRIMMDGIQTLLSLSLDHRITIPHLTVPWIRTAHH